MEDDLALRKLAVLLRIRNELDARIARVIDRPALTGHLGEYVAASVFGIALNRSASHKGCDGQFVDGPLAGRSVNVKCYSRQESVLDINATAVPDCYLVLAGPREFVPASRGTTRPFVIESVYLFNAPELVESLRTRGVKVGIATGLRVNDWKSAEIYPEPCNTLVRLDAGQRELLKLFGNRSLRAN